MTARRRLRVLVVHPSDELYGADRVLLEVLRTAPAEADIEVWLPTDLDYPRRELSTELKKRRIRHRRLPLPILRRAYLRPGQIPALAGRLFSAALALVRYRPDVLYINTSAGSALAPIGRLLGARVVLHLHEHIAGNTRVVLPLVGAAHAVIAVSNAIIDPLPPRTRRKTTVVYNGFDLPPSTPLPPLGPSNPLVLLMASRWNGWKGHQLLLAAWNLVEREDLQLRILGAPPPSGEAVDVPALVAESTGNDRITLVGQTSDVRAQLDAAHVVLVPSVLPDPLPTIAIEALGAGRALLGSDLGGLPEIVGDAGLLVPAGDERAWAAALEELDTAQVTRLADASRGRFDSLFSRDRFDEEIRRVLWKGGSRR